MERWVVDLDAYPLQDAISVHILSITTFYTLMKSTHRIQFMGKITLDARKLNGSFVVHN